MRVNPNHGNLDDSQPGKGAETGASGGSKGSPGPSGPLAAGATGTRSNQGRSSRSVAGPGSDRRMLPADIQAALGDTMKSQVPDDVIQPEVIEERSALPPRRRKRVRKFEDSWRQKIATRVCDMAEKDMLDRVVETEMRLQRNAKLRQWTEGKTFPWPGASDVSNSDMMMDSLRQQDTLHDAVMSTRPTIGVTAIDQEEMVTQTAIENHLDVQLFDEQPGERFIGDLAEAFVNEGHATVFSPWIREERKIRTVRIFPMIPEEEAPFDYFRELLSREFNDHNIFPASDSFFDWAVTDKKDPNRKINISFYTNEAKKQVEMDTSVLGIVHDGPRSIVKYWREVLAPQRAKNLQPPSPSNPGGAAHVILVDSVSVDELIRLADSGFYDLVSKKDIEAFKAASHKQTGDKEYMDEQDDAFEGKNSDEKNPEDPRHKNLTRYMCFDVAALTHANQDPEDVIFWVIEETRTLVRAKFLGEQYPSNPPRRPLTEGQMLPWMGRREGIGLPELTEGLFDMKKQIIDQGIDSGTLANTPFFFYKPHSALKPEVLTMAPGDGMPLQDPKNDILIADFQQRGQEFMFNTVAMLDRMREQLTMLGDIQRGAVPAGKSSALRTAGGIQQLLQQGESRPERILRRFMMIIRDTVEHYHMMNQTFLSDEKKFLAGNATPGSPRMRVTREMYLPRKKFKIKANILNSSKQARQQSLERQMQVFVSPIALQLGVVDAGGIYRLFRDWALSHGTTDPSQYLTEPMPMAGKMRITADQAFGILLDGEFPEGVPAEGAAGHLQRLEELSETPVETVVNGMTQKEPALSLLDEVQREMFRVYARDIQAQAKGDMQQQSLQDAAAGFQQTIGGDQGGRPPDGQLGDMSPGQLGPGQLADKSLPSEQGAR